MWCGRKGKQDALATTCVAEPWEGGSDAGGRRAFNEAAEDVAHCTSQDGENGDGDQQSDDGVGQREAQGDATGSKENGERGESVSAGV